MVRKSVEASIKESLLRQVENRTRLKRLLIEKTLRDSPDAVGHVYDLMHQIGLFKGNELPEEGEPKKSVDTDEKKDAIPRVIPQSSFTTKCKARAEARKNSDRPITIPKTYTVVSDFSAKLLQQRLIFLRPESTPAEYDRHLTHWGRPDVTKGNHLRILEAMVGVDLAALKVRRFVSFQDLDKFLGEQHELRAKRFVSMPLSMDARHWCLFDVEYNDEGMPMVNCLFLQIDPVCIPIEALPKLLPGRTHMGMEYEVKDAYSESKARFVSALVPSWAGIPISCMAEVESAQHVAAIEDAKPCAPRGKRAKPLDDKPTNRERSVFKQLAIKREPMPDDSMSSEQALKKQHICVKMEPPTDLEVLSSDDGGDQIDEDAGTCVNEEQAACLALPVPLAIEYDEMAPVTDEEIQSHLAQVTDAYDDTFVEPPLPSDE